MVVIDIFNKTRKCCNHRYADSVYFNTLLFSIYFSATETLTCRRKMSLTASASFDLHEIRYMIFKKCHKKKNFNLDAFHFFIDCVGNLVSAIHFSTYEELEK